MRHNATWINMWRLSSILGVLLSLPISVSSTARAESTHQSPPLPVPILVTPPDGSSTPDLTPTFDWEDIVGAARYRIQIDDNDDFDSPAADSQPEGSTYTPNNALSNGTYYWHVRAYIAGEWSDYSSSWSFIVNGTPPSVPFLSAPPDGSTTPDLTPTFDWDDVVGAHHYRIQVDDNTDFSSPNADSQPTNSTYTPSNALTTGTYYWRVRTNDGMGNWGDYSSVWVLIVNGTPPPVPTLLSPENGATTPDVTPTFDWDDVAGAAQYRIQVDDNTDFSSPNADSQPTNSIYTPGNALPNGTYYWRVRAADAAGNWSDYSLAWTLNINGTLLPAPTLLTPTNSSTTPDLTPTFDWSDVPSADHYRIQVDDNVDFSSPNADSQPTNSIYTPSNALPNGTYYWRVRTADNMGNWGEYGATWTLFVSGILLPPPNLLTPTHNSTTPDFTPTFDWSDVPSADHYRIQADNDSDFSSPIADSQPTSSTYTPSNALPNGTYYWRVRTADSMGTWGEYSSAWVLTINGVPPPAPTLLTPTNGSTTPDFTPTFDWSDVSGADHYRIQIDDNADFSSPAADSQPGNSTYTPSTQLSNGIYYWRIRTADNMGNWGNYSPAWSLVVNGTSLPAPVLLTPPNGSTTPDFTPVFDWNDVSGADHYRIQIDNDADFSSPSADSQPTSSTYTPKTQLSNGTYHWHVRTVDAAGNWGDYGTVWTFVVNGILLPAPTLLTPANDSATSDLTPIFDWDDVPGADHYRIQVDNDADFSSPSADSQPKNSTYTPNNAFSIGTYYWRVRTADTMGNWGDYSIVWVLIVNGTLPSAPTLLAPANGSTTPDLTPAFDWNDIPGADHYRIQVDDNADFSSPAADSQPKSSAYTPNKALVTGTYYWRVRTADTMGNWSGYSPAWTLIINGILPPAPSLLTPANGSTTSDLTPAFDWSDVSGADHYRIQIDDNVDFSSPVADSQPLGSKYSPRKVLTIGTYYWHVRTTDTMDNWGDYSPAWKLSIIAASETETASMLTASTSEPESSPLTLEALPPAEENSVIEPTPKTVYLTFDDGPDPSYTPQLIAYLQQQDIQATFFVNGVDRNGQWGGVYFTSTASPDDLVPITTLDGERIVTLMDQLDLGIGLHGWHHGSAAHPEDFWDNAKFDLQMNIIQEEQALIALDIGFDHLLRAPGGAFPASPFPDYQDWYYYGWDVNARDGYGVSPQAIVDNVIDGLSMKPDYPIILLHAGRPNTLQAIIDPRYDLIGKIRALGYTGFDRLPRPIDHTGFPPNGSTYKITSQDW